MKLMHSEWQDRVKHWVRTLRDDFYEPLGEIRWEAFRTMDHLSPEEALQGHFTSAEPGFIWGKTWEYCWFKGTVILPKAAEGKRIVMNLDAGGESTVFVNGKAFGNYRAAWVDEPHQFIEDNCLAVSGKEGDTYEILMETYAGHFYPEAPTGGCATGPVLPGAYTDPKKEGARCVLGTSTFGVWNEDAYQLFMDVDTLGRLLETMDSTTLRAAKIAKALEKFTLIVDFEQPREARIASYKEAREALRPLMEAKNGSTMPVFYAIGNAHLDLAWLWPMEETHRKTERTFAAQLRLIEQYPEYKYVQSQPAAYEMCRKYYPELFERIKEAIKGGQWIADGAMWVEPDTNMASGEALIRQLVHGKRYYKEELGVDSEVLWLPDTFGYTAALPQILKGCGVNYLVTQKIFWSYNEGEQFPYHYFTWQGMDGSEIDSFLPTSYTYRTHPSEVNKIWQNRVQVQDLDAFLLPFGYGDGGGGPARDFIESAKRQEDLEGSVKVKMAGPLEFFHDMEAQGGPANTYVGELYFSAHRGTYTSQAMVKQNNRRCELALREMEMWSTLAMNKGMAYDFSKADALWKELLLHQFHDILPGSSIAKVYVDAEKAFHEILDGVEELQADALSELTDQKESQAVTVFNSLSFPRKMLVELPAAFANGAKTVDGTAVQVQKIGDTVKASVEVPSCGAVSLIPAEGQVEEKAVAVETCDGGFTMENSQVKAAVNEKGEVISFVLKESGREFAADAMNRFHLYKDVPRLFDAWDIDSNYIDQEIEAAKMHRLLKAGFPVNVYAENGINEMQFGFVEHPTHRSRAYDKDRFEVCNHCYSALADGAHGAAVLNDCKYGISMNGNALELTLLRAGTCPEMCADNRVHHFTYAFTAWEGSFAESDVVRQGYELNVKPVVAGGVVPTFSALTIDKENVILDTMKPAEDGSGDIILRLYESKKAAVLATVTLSDLLQGEKVYLCDMLENCKEEISVENGEIPLNFRAFEVKTVRIKK